MNHAMSDSFKKEFYYGGCIKEEGGRKRKREPRDPYRTI